LTKGGTVEKGGEAKRGKKSPKKTMTLSELPGGQPGGQPGGEGQPSGEGQPKGQTPT
jgi:hypothetical protein